MTTRPGQATLGHTVRESVSWLFVPASRPERIANALASGAQEVIIDLEDGVGPADKSRARQFAVTELSAGATCWVRINDVHSPWFEEDVEALNSVHLVLQGFVLPKADLEAAASACKKLAPELPVVALIESATGVRDAYEVAGFGRISQLAFGAIDYALDIDSSSPDSLDHARHVLVAASRAARKPPPIDGVSVAIRDLEVLAADCQHARSLGFGGKLCIHPSQVEPVHRAFAPTTDEIAWAGRVLRARERSSDGAFAVDGRMVDAPVVALAQRIAARASMSDQDA